MDDAVKEVLLNRRQMLLMSALILFTQLIRNVRQQFAIIDISMPRKVLYNI